MTKVENLLMQLLNISDMTGAEHRISSAYHPKTNHCRTIRTLASFLYVFHRLDRCSYHSPLTALSDISWLYCEWLDESSMVMDYHTAHKDHTPGQDVQHTKVLSSSTQNSV